MAGLQTLILAFFIIFIVLIVARVFHHKKDERTDARKKPKIPK